MCDTVMCRCIMSYDNSLNTNMSIDFVCVAATHTHTEVPINYAG